MDETFDLRQWLIKELNVKPYHIENHIFAHNGKSRKKEMVAMWHNKQDKSELKKWILSVVVPASKTLSYINSHAQCTATSDIST
jgi:hypothetical protein